MVNYIVKSKRELRKCRCRQEYYCSKECRQERWSVHRHSCPWQKRQPVKDGEYPFHTAPKMEEDMKEDKEWEEDKELKRALEMSMSTEKPSNTTDFEGSLPLSVDDFTDVEASLPLSVDASEPVDGYESNSSLPPLVSAESDDNSDSDSTEKESVTPHGSPPGGPLDSDSDASLPALVDDSESDTSNSD